MSYIEPVEEAVAGNGAEEAAPAETAEVVAEEAVAEPSVEASEAQA